MSFVVKIITKLKKRIQKSSIYTCYDKYFSTPLYRHTVPTDTQWLKQITHLQSVAFEDEPALSPNLSQLVSVPARSPLAGIPRNADAPPASARELCFHWLPHCLLPLP